MNGFNILSSTTPHLSTNPWISWWHGVANVTCIPRHSLNAFIRVERNWLPASTLTTLGRPVCQNFVINASAIVCARILDIGIAFIHFEFTHTVTRTYFFFDREIGNSGSKISISRSEKTSQIMGSAEAAVYPLCASWPTADIYHRTERTISLALTGRENKTALKSSPWY